MKILLYASLFSIFLTTAVAKRAAPRAATPVTHDGTVYSAPHGAGQIGLVQARDASTKAVLWEQVIYKIEHDPDLERDVQWVFIADLKIEGRLLIITDERNRRYSLDLKTRKVSKLKQADKPDPPAA